MSAPKKHHPLLWSAVYIYFAVRLWVVGLREIPRTTDALLVWAAMVITTGAVVRWLIETWVGALDAVCAEIEREEGR